MSHIDNPSKPLSNRIVDARHFGVRSSLPGVGISTEHLIGTCRSLGDDDADAVRWFAGYARLLDRTNESFADVLGMDAQSIRQALTNPHLDDAVRGQFTGGVGILREQWERRVKGRWRKAGNPFQPAKPFHRGLGELVDTANSRKVASAVRWAVANTGLAKVRMKERSGKTVSAAHQFLLRLDRAAWVRVPTGDDVQGFLRRVARALGVTHSDKGSIGTMMGRIERVMGAHGFTLLFLDQAHWIWPSDPRKQIARRYELVMDWMEDLGVAFVMLTTPQQDDERCGAAATNRAHAYGQISGRTMTFRGKDTVDDAELLAIIAEESDGLELHETVVNSLVTLCKADSGYLGTLRLTVQRIVQSVGDGKPRSGETTAGFHSRIGAAVVAEAKEGGAK